MHLESRPQAVQTDPTLPALVSRFTATIYSAVSKGTLVVFGVMLVTGANDLPRKSILMISHALIDTTDHCLGSADSARVKAEVYQKKLPGFTIPYPVDSYGRLIRYFPKPASKQPINILYSLGPNVQYKTVLVRFVSLMF